MDKKEAIETWETVLLDSYGDNYSLIVALSRNFAQVKKSETRISKIEDYIPLYKYNFSDLKCMV